MADAPTLRQVEDALRRVGKLVPAITEEARWAWPMGYERRRGERSGGGMGVSKPTESAVGTNGSMCKAGDCPVHPDGDVWHPASPEWIVRNEVRICGDLVMKAVTQMEGARAALERAAAAAGREDQPSAPVEEQRIRIVKKSEVAKAKQMRQWREQEREEERRETRRAWGYGEY